jgi:hypothetical protein
VRPETKTAPAVQRARGRLVVTQYNTSFSTERRQGVGGAFIAEPRGRPQV